MWISSHGSRAFSVGQLRAPGLLRSLLVRLGAGPPIAAAHGRHEQPT